MLRDLLIDFFDIDFFDSSLLSSFFNSFLIIIQFSIRLISYIARYLYIIKSLRYDFDFINQICDQCNATLFKNEISERCYNNNKIEIVTFKINVL